MVILEFEEPPAKCKGICFGGCKHFTGLNYKQALISCWMDNRAFEKKSPRQIKKWNGVERRH